jgi:hypothetical protein
MRPGVLVLAAACVLPTCAAYFDINLLSNIAQLKVKQAAELKTERLERRRLNVERRRLDDPATDDADNGSFWERLGAKGKGPGKRAAITTMIAVAVVVVVCVCCWCVPICEIACWRSRDDNVLNETYLPEEKPPTVVRHYELGEDAPVAAGDDDLRARRPLSVVP